MVVMQVQMPFDRAKESLLKMRDVSPAPKVVLMTMFEEPRYVRIIEHVIGHYEVQAVEMGTVYIWCPESVVIECDCGQTFTTEGAMVVSCPRCGAEHTGLARELGDKKPLTEEEAYRPVRGEYEAWMKDEGSPRRHSEGLYGEGLFSGLAAKDERNRILNVLYGS